MNEPTRYEVADQPRWCRQQYVSGREAPDYWNDAIRRIGRAWRRAEWGSVVFGLRDAALVFLDTDEAAEVREVCQQFGLAMFVVTQASGRYMVCRPEIEQRLTEAANGSGGFDDDVIGAALGYPECCRRQFREEWGRNLPMWRDPVIPMVQRTGTRDGYLAENCHPAANILLRKMGVRYCPHLPCRADCEASRDFGMTMREAMYRVDPIAANAADRLLMAPMEWSSWHGMGEFITPAFRYSFDTDPVAEKFTVRRRGVGFLDGAGTNGQFPFGEQRSSAVRNGFKTHAAMDHAHQGIEGFVRERLGGSVLDLGCGDGRLARRLSGFGRCFGVEAAVQASDLAREQLYDVRRARIERVDDWLPMVAGEQIDLILFQPGRLVEASSPALESFLIENAPRVLLYNYDGKLKEFAVRSGLASERMVCAADNGVELAWLADVATAN